MVQAALPPALLCVSHHVVLPLHHPHQCPVLLALQGAWDLPVLRDVAEHPVLWDLWDLWDQWDLLEPQDSPEWPHLHHHLVPLFACTGQQLSTQVEECHKCLQFRPYRVLLNVSKLVAVLHLLLRRWLCLLLHR